MKYLLAILFSSFVLDAQNTVGPKGLQSNQTYTLPVSSLSDNVSATGVTTPDGDYILLSRYRSPGAAGVRLLIRNYHAPDGARFFIYSPDGSVIAGPLAASEMAMGEFWTPPIPGDTAIVEFQGGEGFPSTQPFSVVQVAAINASDLAALAAPIPVRGESSDVLRTSVYQGVPLTHTVRDGLAIYEGDIVLGEAAELPAASSFLAKRKESFGSSFPVMLWPSGLIPYTIDPALPSPERITGGVAAWNSTTGGMIRLVPRSNEAVYVVFTRASSSGLCSSFVGRLGFAQPIYIGDSCSLGNVIHELGHTVGLFHEHTRTDRDSYVRVNWANLDPNAVSSYTIGSGLLLGGYDYGSIMHYPAGGNSINGLNTIDPLVPGVTIGQRIALSGGDLSGVAKLYGVAAPAPPPVPVTGTLYITTNPPGLPAIVDGVTINTPYTSAAAVVGTQHSVSTPAQVSAGSTRYAFASWSNGSPQTFTFAQPQGQAAFTASYTVQYQVVASASSGGTVSVTPQSSDSFYTAGTQLSISATAQPGYCMTGWNGLIAAAPPSTSLIVDRPYTVSANFNPGNVTFSQAYYVLKGGGGLIDLPLTTNSGCSWTASTMADWIGLPNGKVGSGGVLTISVSPNPTAYLRYNIVVVNGSIANIYQFGN